MKRRSKKMEISVLLGSVCVVLAGCSSAPIPPTYTQAGGDGYASLTKGRPIIHASGAALMANVVIDRIAARGTVLPGVEGRIIERK